MEKCNCKSQIVISVITVCFNAEDVIERTMCSVLCQKAVVFEYIIIDGKSNDRTNIIIRQTLEKYKSSSIEIKYLSEKDSGIYNAMNKAVDIASGEYVLFMNAGDEFIDKNVLANISKCLTNTDEIVYGNHYSVLNNKRKIHMPITQEGRLPLFCHQSSLTKRDLLLKCPFDESYRIIADADFFQKQFINGKQFRYIDITIANYDIQGISSTNLKERQEEIIRSNINNGRGIESEIKKIRRRFMFIRIKRFLRNLAPGFIVVRGYEEFDAEWWNK